MYQLRTQKSFHHRTDSLSKKKTWLQTICNCPWPQNQGKKQVKLSGFLWEENRKWRGKVIKSNSFIQNLIAFRHSTRFLETFNHKFLSKVENNSISASPLSSWRHGSYTPFYLTHSWFEPNHNSFIHRCLKKTPKRESMCCHLKRAEARVDPCHSLHYHFETPLQDLRLILHDIQKSLYRQNAKEKRNYRQNIL